MLYLRKLLRSKPKLPEGAPLAPLYTPWGEKVAAAARDGEPPLAEHPRPQFARERWATLNGWWDYAVVSCEDAARAWRSAALPDAFDGRILVPFSPEALLSGVGRVLQPAELLWYRRSFEAPRLAPGERLLLHFEGVDYACACYANGRLVGTHKGAYLPFVYDITDFLAPEPASNDLALCVFDPSNTGTQLRGKQRLDRGGIWYTPQSGIWQSVWLEVVPAAHIAALSIEPDADEGLLTLRIDVAGGPAPLAVRLCADGHEAAYAGLGSFAGGAVELAVPAPRLWSPDDPFLYDLGVRFGDDEVLSYCAFRTVGVEPDEKGRPRFCLNHRPLFLRGLLDQGYWSDGLLTAPADEALAYDVQTARDLGFNLLRKHIKVESSRWYWHCDRLGMLVLQDMPCGGGFPYDRWHTSYKPSVLRSSWRRMGDTGARSRRRLCAADPVYCAEWLATCEDTVARLKGHPCVAAWCLFNEGWGQFDSRAAADRVRALDPTRPVDAVSGWYDQGAGDFQSVHNYFRTLAVYRDFARPPRAFLLSEFGGVSLRLPGHCALPTSYGYEEAGDEQAFVRDVGRELAAVEALWARGLAGYVYTQLSDVEEETNGLLTYDRRVNKLRPAEGAGDAEDAEGAAPADPAAPSL